MSFLQSPFIQLSLFYPSLLFLLCFSYNFKKMSSNPMSTNKTNSPILVPYLFSNNISTIGIITSFVAQILLGSFLLALEVFLLNLHLAFGCPDYTQL